MLSLPPPARAAPGLPALSGPGLWPPPAVGASPGLTAGPPPGAAPGRGPAARAPGSSALPPVAPLMEASASRLARAGAEREPGLWRSPTEEAGGAGSATVLAAPRRAPNTAGSRAELASRRRSPCSAARYCASSRRSAAVPAAGGPTGRRGGHAGLPRTALRPAAAPARAGRGRPPAPAAGAAVPPPRWPAGSSRVSISTPTAAAGARLARLARGAGDGACPATSMLQAPRGCAAIRAAPRRMALGASATPSSPAAGARPSPSPLVSLSQVSRLLRSCDMRLCTQSRKRRCHAAGAAPAAARRPGAAGRTGGRVGHARLE